MAGTAGVADAHLPHVFDALQILKFASDQLTPLTISRCWLKCGILSDPQETQLKAWIETLKPKKQKKRNNNNNNNLSSAEGTPTEPPAPPSSENGDDIDCDAIVERLRELSIPDYPKDANINENCFAACAEAQKAVSAENSSSLLKQWQQFDDSENVIIDLISESADELEFDDEVELLNVSDNESEDEVAGQEEPTAPMTNAIAAAAKALDKLRDVSVESMSWPEAKPLLSAIIAPTLVVMRSLQGVPPGLLGETQQFEQSLLNAKLPSASAKRKQPQSKKTLSSSSVFKKKCRRGEIARMASTGDR